MSTVYQGTGSISSLTVRMAALARMTSRATISQLRRLAPPDSDGVMGTPGFPMWVAVLLVYALDLVFLDVLGMGEDQRLAHQADGQQLHAERQCQDEQHHGRPVAGGDIEKYPLRADPDKAEQADHEAGRTAGAEEAQ